MAKPEPTFKTISRYDQIEWLTDRLRQTWEEVPDLRLGQLISVVSREMGWRDLFYVSDEQAYDALLAYRETLVKVGEAFEKQAEAGPSVP